MTPSIPQIPVRRPQPVSATAPPPQTPHRRPDSVDDDQRAVRAREAAIDAALEMTFPASDPPAWTS